MNASRVLKDPLLHFLLLGAAAFAVFQLTRTPAETAEGDEIVVSADQVAQLVAVFAKTWQRPPTEDERDRLIENRVREEVLYREALAAGLDRDDSVVRRRMNQKLEFMVEDIAGQVAPTDEELRSFLEENADRFRSDAVFDFRQVYFSTDRRKDAEGDARDALARAGERDPEGDSLLMVEAVFRAATQREVERSFGREFAAALLELPTGAWTGPVRSGYGIHLVFVDQRTEGRLPDLDEMRDAVTSEWQVVKRREMQDALYGTLRSKYTIRVEQE